MSGKILPPAVTISSMSRRTGKFVSRAGEKLDAALEAFGLDMTGLLCADFGCNVGGFTDCLLRRGARKVYAVDTGYGELAWKLRNDERVVVMERINALYVEPPEPVDLVTIDVAWTSQVLIVPVAMKWLKPGGKIVSLLKPHYEFTKLQGRKPASPLPVEQAQQVCRQVCQHLSGAGCDILAAMRSVLLGKGRNVEFILLLAAGSRNA